MNILQYWCIFIAAVYLILTFVLADEEKLFKKFGVSPSSLENFSGLGDVSTTLKCAGECNSIPTCMGFLYTSSNRTCLLFSYVDVTEESSNSTLSQDAVYLLPISQTLARGKPTSMSFVCEWNGVQRAGDFAVDGIYRPPSNDESLSIAHSDMDENPWLRINLENVHNVWAVRILNRGGEQVYQIDLV
ncbi:uncharacterized protein [Watersipora subatra]|uniref:uncharacterized protein n=1 Tax=Watersipora subatra TaxID=2589382 RepID=UPI00355B1D12